MTIMAKIVFIFLAAWIVVDLATHPSAGPVVTRLVGTTENPEARKDFDKALLLLHNFEYPDAAELFRSAQQKDPQFALAYWGEAMSFNHPVWLSQDTEAARGVLKKYQAVSRQQTRQLPILDADLLASLDLLYGEGTKRERDEAYADFMATLYDKYPGNQDVAAFYALSLLGQAGGWNENLCNQAADVAGRILKENPEHPGALHYFIHAEDHPDFARNAWDQANQYARVASYSGHALHMPSHIYLALGSWDNVVKSNEISWKAGVDRKDAKGLNNDALNYHAHWWLAYGYLQQGRFSKAREIVQRQLAFTRELPSSSARNHFVIMRGHYLVETNDWQNQLAAEDVKIQDLRIEIRTLDRFVKGLRAFRMNDARTLDGMVAEIDRDLATAGQMKVINDGITACKAVPTGKGGIIQASVLQEELKALQAFMRNDHQGADDHFKKAIGLEEANGHFFGPPETMKTANELYGEFQLATGKYKDAVLSFGKALQKAPGRNLALHGLMRAASLNGDKQKEKQAAEALKANLHASDGSPLQDIFSVH